MPKNLEKTPLSDEEKRARDRELEQKEKERKETGWKETFERRHEILKEVAEGKKMEKEEVDQKEAKLTEEREKLPEAYGEALEDKEKEVERLIKETEDELSQKLDQERGLSGKKLSDTEKYVLVRNFYLGKFGYEIKYRGLFGGKARIWNEQKGGYVIDEKTGKPVEFEAKFSPKGETPFLKFLEEEYKNKIKKDLEKKYREKAGEAQAAKVEEPEAVEKEEETETAKVVTQKAEVEKIWKGIDFKRMEAEGEFERMKKMKIDKNSEDIIAIIKKYYTLPPDARTYAGSLLRKYDQLRFEQYKFEKAKRNPESLKEWIASFLTDIKDSENVEKLRKVKLKTEKKEGKPEEKTDEVKPTKIEELLETEIERMNRREVPQSIRPELKQYLVENGFSADKIDEMIPKEAWQEAIRIYKGEATKQQGENPAERIPEILSDLDEEEPEGRLKKGKRKETSKRERRKEQRKAGEE